MEREIEQFNARRAEKKIELEDKEDVQQTENYEFDEITKKVNEHDRKVHSLISDRQREQDLYTQKARYIKSMCAKLNINVTFDIENSNERAADLVTSIKAAMATVDGKIKELIANNEREDEKLEKEIRKYSDEGSRVEAELIQITNRLKESKSTLAQQSEELRKIERSTGKLKDVQKNIETIQRNRTEFEAKADSQGVRAQIVEHRTEKQRLSDELEGVDTLITMLSTMATLLAEVTTKEKQLEKRESEAHRIQNKHADSLKRLWTNQSIDVGIKRKIESLNQELRLLVNRLEAENRLKENQMNASKIQLQNKMKELKQMETEQRNLEEQIYAECEHLAFDDVLATVKENVDKYQMEYSELKSSDVFYKK